MVDNFETAIKRVGRAKGYVVAFSFGKGAHEEAARAKAHEGLDIELVTVEALRDGSHPLVQAESTLFGPQAPAIEPRATNTLPRVEDLLSSNGVTDAKSDPEGPSAP